MSGLGSREDEGAARRRGHRYTAPRWCVSLWIMLRPAGNRAEREPTSGTPPAAHPHTDRISLSRRHPNPTLDSRPQRWRRRAGVRRERNPQEGPDGSPAQGSRGDPGLMRSTRLYSHAPRVCDVWDPRPRTRGGAPPRPRGAAVLEERSQAKCTHKDSERPRIQRLGYKLGTLLVLSSTTHHGTRVGTSSLSVLAGWTPVGGDRPPRDRPSFPPARNTSAKISRSRQGFEPLYRI